MTQHRSVRRMSIAVLVAAAAAMVMAAPAGLPIFVEARASASLTDAYPDNVPLWLRDEPGSWDRALDLLIGVVLVEP